jgi:hypothetical protein
MDKDTHCYRVLKHLQNFGSITSFDAIRKFGATRLSAIIYNLRQDGYIVNTEMETGTNRYGKPIRYARYVYDEVNND